jgi:hypothetical protein
MATVDDDTLAMILVSNVLILSKMLNQEAKANGMTRMGGDYTQEAVDMLFAERAKVFQALRRPRR